MKPNLIACSVFLALSFSSVLHAAPTPNQDIASKPESLQMMNEKWVEEFRAKNPELKPYSMIPLDGNEDYGRYKFTYVGSDPAAKKAVILNYKKKDGMWKLDSVAPDKEAADSRKARS